MTDTVPIESVMPIVRPPQGASAYIKKYLKDKCLSANQTANNSV